MADNTAQNGTALIATDGIVTLNGVTVPEVQAQRIKVGFGADSIFRDVDAANGLPVVGTFFQATQPVSIATNTPDVTDRAARALGTIANTGFNATLGAETTKVIGTVNIAAAQSVLVNGGVAPAAAIAGINGLTILGSVSAAAPAYTDATVNFLSLTTGGNLRAFVNNGLTKGTQGTVGLSTQDLKDAGRNAVHYYTLIPVLTSATDTLQSLTGTKAGATVVATATPAVVTAAKTLRVTRVSATYIATATSGYGVVRLRFNTGGVVAITSPVAATIAVGSGTPATANATGTVEAVIDESWEFAAGTGIGISVQGFAAVTATAVGYVFVAVTGYEY